MTFVDVSQNWLDPLSRHYIVVQYSQQMVQMAFCDLLHRYHKHIINIFQLDFVNLLWGFFMSSLTTHIPHPIQP